MVADRSPAYRVRITNLHLDVPQTKPRHWPSWLRFASVSAIRHLDRHSTFDVVRGDAFGNMRRAEAFNRLYNLPHVRESGCSADRSQQILARSSSITPNTETFFSQAGGILEKQRLFRLSIQATLQSKTDQRGAAIATEISHSFDELGNIYAHKGRLGMWWTAEDTAKIHAGQQEAGKPIDGYCCSPVFASMASKS